MKVTLHFRDGREVVAEIRPTRAFPLLVQIDSVELGNGITRYFVLSPHPLDGNYYEAVPEPVVPTSEEGL